MSSISVRKLHVPSEWESAAAEIFDRRLRTILVIGGSAVGKTSFCRYLAEALLARQAEVAFVDADIGQSNLGPPTAVTLGFPTSPVDFSTVPAAAYYFIGSTGPIGRFLPLVIGAGNLAREARGAFVIIDTTGLVQGSPPNLERSRASRSSTKTRSASSRRCTRLGSMVMPITNYSLGLRRALGLDRGTTEQQKGSHHS